jgi:hypothetical protein
VIDCGCDIRLEMAWRKLQDVVSRECLGSVVQTFEREDEDGRQ